MYTMYTFTLVHLESTNETDRRRPRPRPMETMFASSAVFPHARLGYFETTCSVACAADVSIWRATFGLVFVDIYAEIYQFNRQPCGKLVGGGVGGGSRQPVHTLLRRR